MKVLKKREPDVRCNVCSHQFAGQEYLIAVTGAYIIVEGPEPDSEPWLATYCQDCWDHTHTDIEICQQNVRDASRE